MARSKTAFVSVEVKDTIDQYLGEVRDRLDGAARAGVIAAINEISDRVKSNVRSASFNTSSSKQFGVPLIKGVNTFMIKGYPIGVTNILGQSEPNDGTWRLRFYEGGTKERVRKNGASTGRIKAHHFFNNAITSAESIAQKMIDDRIQNVIKSINKQND